MKRVFFSFIIVLLSVVFCPSVSALNETDGFFCTEATVTDNSSFYSEIYFRGEVQVGYIEFTLTLPEGMSLISYIADDDGELFSEDGKYRFVFSAVGSINFNDGKRLIKLIMRADEDTADGNYTIKADDIKVIDTDGNTYTPDFSGGLIKILRRLSVSVPETDKNCNHRFDGWTVTSSPDYDKTGERVKICTVCGKICKTLKIPAVPAYSISLAEISFEKTGIYTGKALKPRIGVCYNGVPLEEDKDYTVSYKNNKSVGTGSIIVKGIGAFEGETTLNFSIKPKSSSITKVSTLKNGKVKIKWKKVSACDGYRIYVRYPGKDKYKLLKTVKKPSVTSYTTGKLKSDGKYRFKIRTYVSGRENKIFSSYSKIKVFRL